MRKTNQNLMLCGMVFVAALVTSNVIAAKTIQTGIPLFGTTIVVPAAVLCYCLTFLMTDVVGEIWGRAEAQRIVWAGFACQLLSTALVALGQVLPAADTATGAAYDALLGQNAVFVAASLGAYLLSQSWDVFVFHKIRNFFLGRDEQAVSKRWIWNNASTMTSQAIDTLVYISVAFGLGMGWFFDAAMWPTLAAMMVGQARSTRRGSCRAKRARPRRVATGVTRTVKGAVAHHARARRARSAIVCTQTTGARRGVKGRSWAQDGRLAFGLPRFSRRAPARGPHRPLPRARCQACGRQRR